MAQVLPQQTPEVVAQRPSALDPTQSIEVKVSM